jgi:hypothetical protein
MANANTVVDALRQAGVPSDQPLSLTNPGGNNPWLFVLPASSASNGGQPVVLEVPSVAANGVENGAQNGNPLVINPWYADGNTFLVRAMGRVAPNNGSKTLKLYLYSGTGLAGPGQSQGAEVGFGSATLPATSTGNVYSNWYLESKCLWDSQSLQLNCVTSGMIAGTAIAAVAFSINNPSNWLAQQAAGAYLNLPFVIGANLSSSAAAGQDIVTLDEFTAEML